MVLRFLCTLCLLATIGCYSVSEEEVENDEPSIPQLAVATKQEKSLNLNSLKSDLPSEHEDRSPYNNDADVPIKAVKYKNYGYFHPSVATLKISRQVAKPAALQAAAGGFQFKTDRNIAALMGSNGTGGGRPVFHFQRRLDEAQPIEFEEVDDSVNVRDRKVRPNSFNPSPRSHEYHRRPSPYINIVDTRGDNVADPETKRRPSLRVSPGRVAATRRNFQRTLKTSADEKDSSDVVDNTSQSLSEEPSTKTLQKVAKGNFETSSNNADENVDVSDEDFGKILIKNSINRSDAGSETGDKSSEAVARSRAVQVDEIAESEDSNLASDIDLNQEYRKPSRVQSFSARGRGRPRHKVERSLAEPEPIEVDGASSTHFIPTPIPGFLYPKSSEVVDNSTSELKKGDTVQTSSATESVSPMSTYFLPTRPAGAVSEEDQSLTDGLSSYHTLTNAAEVTGASSKRPPMFFVTAVNEIIENGPSRPDQQNGPSRPDQQNGPSRPDLVEATVEEEINEKKNFSIEDFYNAFSANVTEYPNRHRDPDEGDSVVSPVNSASSGSFLAFAPHFPSSPVSDLQSSRAIKYPCTCDKGKCGCCTGRIISNFNINIPARGCLNITYIPEDFEFNVKMTYNDRTLAQRRVSGKNPRPMCVPLPRITGSAQACVRLSNVYLVGRNVHMCLDLEARRRDEELFKVSFDCVRMGTNGVAWIKPEDGGGLGPPPVVEGPAPDDYDAVVAAEGDDITSAKGNKKKTDKDSGKITKTGGKDSRKPNKDERKPSKDESRPVKDGKNKENGGGKENDGKKSNKDSGLLKEITRENRSSEDSGEYDDY